MQPPDQPMRGTDADMHGADILRFFKVLAAAMPAFWWPVETLLMILPASTDIRVSDSLSQSEVSKMTTKIGDKRGHTRCSVEFKQ